MVAGKIKKVAWKDGYNYDSWGKSGMPTPAPPVLEDSAGSRVICAGGRKVSKEGLRPPCSLA